MIFENQLKMNIGASIYFALISNAGLLFFKIVFASKDCFEYLTCDPKDQCGCGKKSTTKIFIHYTVMLD